MTWTPVIFNGQQYRQYEGKTLVPIDNNGGPAIILLKDDMAVGSGFSAVEQGPPGLSPTFLEAVNVTPLAYNDPTPDSASLTVITPPSTESGGVYKWNITSRAGETGEDGKSVWDPTDLSPTPVAGQIPAVKSSLDGFDLVAQKIPEVFNPGTINNVASGNANFTMAQINIPSRPWARRVRGVGFTVITGEGADVRVNLLARLNGESGGNIVGRCVGITQTERLTLAPGKPIESGTVADTYDQIAANASAVLYIRTERQAGTTTYTASASSSQFAAEVWPL